MHLRKVYGSPTQLDYSTTIFSLTARLSPETYKLDNIDVIMGLSEATPEIKGESKSLVVMLHAPTSCPEDLDHVKRTIAENIRNADLLIPRLPLSLSSNADPIDLTIGITEAIDRAEEQRKKRIGQSYEIIILIGHCVGALIARKVYVFACGENEDAHLEVKLKRRAWADKVTRIILLAALNRGWSIEGNLFRPMFVFYRFCELAARLLGEGKLWLSCRRGALFITELRIQWLAMVRHNPHAPLVIQLLGTVDDLVTPDDNVDLQAGKDFIYLEVPQSGHKNVIDFEGEAGTVRRERFLHALTAPVEQLKRENDIQIAPEHEIDENIKHVVFVVHGIRDHGFWTSRVARRIRRVARQESKTYITITSSYGYFPMWPFIFSYIKRQTNVRWFMDQYTMALAKYPNAKFSFVGHSNGTYLLASALRNYPSCRFDRVVFAGSVIRTSFPWDQMITQDRIKEIRNYVSTSDWVVAIFPGAYEKIGLSDLGSSGSDGFRAHLPVDQHKWVPGAHDAAIREENWQSIAEFIVNGRSASVPKLKTAPSRIVTMLSAGALVCWFMLTMLALGILYGLLYAWPDSWQGFSGWWLMPTFLFFYALYHTLNKV